MQLTDTSRAAIMLVVTNALALAVLLGLNLSADAVAGATSLINSTLIMLALLFKSGQSAAP